MRERGVVTAVDAHSIRVRIGSDLCSICRTEHCSIQDAEIRVRRCDGVPVGAVVDIQTLPGQVLTGIARLVVPPALIVLITVYLHLPAAIVTITAILSVIAMALVGGRRWDLPVVERVLSTGDEVIFRSIEVPRS